MLKNFVAIDLETTGLSPAHSGIIEFGAVRIEDGKPVERFARLCNPGIVIPNEIERITGITNADIANCPTEDEVLAEFLVFIGDSPLVAHNSSFDAGFLRAKAGSDFAVDVCDTLELARILQPTLPAHDLGTLARHFKLPVLTAHRACEDAETAAHLWLALLLLIDELPAPVLDEINWLLAGGRSWLTKLFSEEGRKRVLDGLAGERKDCEYAELFQNFGHLHQKRPAQQQQDLAVDEKLKPDEVAAFFDEDGLLGKSMPGYERRDEQIMMVRKVCEALGTSKHMMIEAGTGTGKSMAYLVPAIIWSVLNKRKIIISTNTKNLQEQLFHKDLPQLEKILPFSFKSALLKGRGNYLCLRKFLHTLTHTESELGSAERRAMLPVVVWAAQTETGDISENTAHKALADYAGLADHLHCIGDECLGKTCRSYRSCFLWRARMLALGADIVIVNHAVVFSDIASANKILPPYNDIIFDEGHNIEAVATDHLGVNVNRMRIVRVLSRLFRKSRRKRNGYLAVAERMTDDEDICRAAEAATNACSRIVQVADDFFAAVEIMMFASKSPNDDVLAFCADDIASPLWEPVGAGAARLLAELTSLCKVLDAMTGVMREIKKFTRDTGRELMQDIAAQSQFLREICTDLDFLIKAAEENHVFWIGRSRPRGRRRETYCTFNSAPVRLAETLKEQLLDKKNCVIASSATMTVGGTFEFFKSRLGFGLLPENRLILADVGSPFDFEKQALVRVTNFLPEPIQKNDAEYTEGLCVFLEELFAATQGRAMVLFTSYKLLNAVYDHISPALKAAGITLLCQGYSGSRAAITRAFQADVRSVLLGTASFWEGVDVAGEALSCLVIAKLPFQVFTDPVFKARYDDIEQHEGGAFMHYSVPNAVIRFRQGFGRLIRNCSDRGAVVIADKRILTKPYGKQFVKSLPLGGKGCARKDELIEDVRRFLASP